MLGPKRLKADERAEVGIYFSSCIAKDVHEANKIVRRGLRDLRISLPLTNDIATSVSSNIQRIRVLESGPAVVRPDGDVLKRRNFTENRFHHLRVMLLHHRVSDGEIEPR